jgi:hypothetical protein
MRNDGTVTFFVVATALLVALGLAQENETSYDPALAMDALYYTIPGYCDEATLPTWSCESCRRRPKVQNVTVAHHDASDSRGIVGYDVAAETIFVSFRGSSNFLNDLEDLDFSHMRFPADCGGCWVHQGFYLSYLAMRAVILTAVQGLVTAYPSVRRILVAGHSLGAAQSVFAFHDVVHNVSAESSVEKVSYNFGQPRAGGVEFALYMATTGLRGHSHFRITHDGDNVPHLPPRWLSYQHFPREVWYKRNVTPSGYRVCNGTATEEDPTCADSVNVLRQNLTDHLYYLGVHMVCDPTSAGN